MAMQGHAGLNSDSGAWKGSRGLATVLMSYLLIACGGGGGSDDAVTVANQSQASTVTSARAVASLDTSTTVDGDVNNLDSVVFSNNSLNQAQAIATPTRVLGYANLAGKGASGRSQNSGDVRDVYSAELQANDAITLEVADAPQADLDLYVYDSNGKLAASALEHGKASRVSVSNAGDYYIEVRASVGASSYVLSVGNAVQPLGLQTQSYGLEADIIPGEVVVKWKTDAAGEKSSSNSGNSLGLIRFAPELQGAEALLGINARQGDKATTLPALQRAATLAAVKAANLRDDVEYAEPNFRRYLLETPNDPGFSAQWNLENIQADMAWNKTTGAADVIVAVLDTGIVAAHPELDGKLDPNDPNGFDFVRSVESANDGDGVDGDAEDSGATESSYKYHGTHVAGIIAAETNNAAGVAGICWRCKIMPLRVIGKNSGSSYDMTQAVLYAAGLKNASGQLPVQKADVINLSLGGPQFSTFEQRAMESARAAGVVVVAAAGNSGREELLYPAAYNHVISVAAVNRANQFAGYSTSNEQVDLAAPGGAVGDGIISASAIYSNGTVKPAQRELTGSSMAAPHVSGVIALMKSIHQDIQPSDVDALLSSGLMTNATDAKSKNNQYGYGILNAEKAVVAALDLASGGSVPVAAELAVFPEALRIAADEVEQQLTLSNVGGAELQINSISANVPWLFITPRNVNTQGLGDYTVSVSRSNLPDGLQRANITVRTSADNKIIPLTVRTMSRNAPNAGQAYYRIDEASGNTVKSDNVAASAGAYEIDMNGLSDGDYTLYLGTDNDNDGQLCDAGEACALNGLGQPGLPFSVRARQADVSVRLELINDAARHTKTITR